MSNVLGENLAFFRRKKKYTQKELAEKIGVTPSFISHIENGISSPSDETLIKISNELGISLDSLRGGNELVNENIQLIKLLSDLTLDLKIKWKFTSDVINDEVYEIGSYNSYCTKYEDMGFFLSYRFNDYVSNAIDFISLNIIDKSKDYDETISTLDGIKENEYLLKLLDDIQGIERDKSPKFDIINSLEKLKNNSSKE